MFGKGKGFAFARGKHSNAVGKRKTFRNLAFGIVIAVKNERQNAGLCQSAHLPGEK